MSLACADEMLFAAVHESESGTSRQLLRRGAMSGLGGEPDSITDGLDQTLLG